MKREVRKIKNMVAAVLATAILLLTVLGYISDAYDYIKAKLFTTADYTDSYVEMLDVGQGDSILLYSGGKAALIDTGIKSYSESVIKAIKLKGIKTLDVLLITHNHSDHMGGIVPITGEIKVKNLVIPDCVKEVYYLAFYGCSNLASISIPAGLKDQVPSWELPKSCKVIVR